MKNHFIFPYCGNKRNEIEKIVKYINFNDIETIIEPFCGSSSMSYYISTIYPNKFKYIINDNNENLIKLYNIMKNNELINEFNNKFNEYINKFNNIDNEEERKKYYLSICKENNVYSYAFITKYYNLRPGIYPPRAKINKIKPFNLKDFPIYNFLNNENVEIYNKDALNIINEYKNNKQALILLDPPYLKACNDFYNNKDINIYEWIYNNDLKKYEALFILILENIWLIKLLFNNYILLLEYDKIYEINKRKTIHLIISNK